MTQREAVNAIAEYVRRYGYSFQEYFDVDDAIDDEENTFIIGWDEENATYLKIQNCSIAPPDEVKWLENIYLANIEQTAGDLSWLGTLKRLRYLSLMICKDKLPETLADISSLRSITLRYPVNGKITRFPSAIRKCINLEEIVVRNAVGPCIELPDWLHEFPKLKNFRLDNCEIKAIPYSLVQTGLEFVLENSLEKQGIHLFGTRLEEGDLGLFG